MEHNGGSMSLVQLRSKEDIELLRKLIDKYHSQGMPRGGGAARRSRFFVWIVEDYWCAGAWIHDNTPFRFIAQKFRIPDHNTYFIRRICKFCPGDYLIDMLNALIDLLRSENREVLWTLGYTRHSNALYKRAGFEEIGVTPRSKHPIFVKYLR